MPAHAIRTYRDGVAIITGGASGIGSALARELARQGAQVVLADLQIDLAEQVAAGIRAHGGLARAALLDVSDFEAVKRVIDDTVAASGRLDYLFNNAGIVIAGEAHLHSNDDWNKVIDVNLRGVVNGIQAAYPLLRRQGFGHIVNTASMAGLLPICGELSYSATKFAVVGLSTSLRMEAESVGVRVSVLCPGAIDTAIVGGGKHGKMLQPIPDEIMKRMWGDLRPIPAEVFATQALPLIAKNRDIIIVPWRWRLIWWLHRLCPGLVVRRLQRQFFRYKKEVEEYWAKNGQMDSL